jgi:hypothetical protein
MFRRIRRYERGEPMDGMKRRDFFEYGLAGKAALVPGSEMPWTAEDKPYAAVRIQTLNFHTTDTLKDVVTNNVINPTKGYLQTYKEDRFPAECPGPHIFVTEMGIMKISITNNLDENSPFFIKGIFNGGPILPGQTVSRFFAAGARFSAQTTWTHR